LRHQRQRRPQRTRTTGQVADLFERRYHQGAESGCLRRQKVKPTSAAWPEPQPVAVSSMPAPSSSLTTPALRCQTRFGRAVTEVVTDGRQPELHLAMPVLEGPACDRL